MSKKSWPHLFAAIAVSLVLIVSMSVGIFRVQREKMIDLLFTSHATAGDVVIVTIDETSIHSIGQWPWPRSVFATLVQNLAGAKVIGIDVDFKEPSRIGTLDDRALALALSNSHVPVVLNTEINDRGRKEGPLDIFIPFSQQAFPNLIIDTDSIVRRAITNRDNFPSLSLRIAQLFDETVIEPTLQPFRIAYKAPNGSVPHILAVDVLNAKIPKQFFENKIVLIGATASDLQDFHLTPFGRMSGVEVQANITQALVDHRLFSEHETANRVLVFLLCLFSAWVCVKLKKLTHLVPALVGIIVAYGVIVFLLFDQFIIIDLLYPLLAVGITSILCIIIQYFSTANEKKFIQETFSRYLAPQVVNKLIADSSNLKLGGEKRNISVLFSDIRGFTALSETMQPEELSHFLNTYLTRMTNVVLDRAGVIDKYIGDAIMAFWGAPLENLAHPKDAVRAALEMISALQILNKENTAQGSPTINIGIGINSGEATVGNMGSEKRFDYTAIGDNVNLASRLEGLNKFYDTNIIVSQATRDAVTDPEILFRELDRVRVKGKKEPVRIFEVVPSHRQATAVQFLDDFQKGLSAYYAGQWDTAIEIFQNITKDFQDGPSAILAVRCKELAARTTSDWEGVWELNEK